MQAFKHLGPRQVCVALNLHPLLTGKFGHSLNLKFLNNCVIHCYFWIHCVYLGWWKSSLITWLLPTNSCPSLSLSSPHSPFLSLPSLSFPPSPSLTCPSSSLPSSHFPPSHSLPSHSPPSHSPSLLFPPCHSPHSPSMHQIIVQEPKL